MGSACVALSLMRAGPCSPALSRPVPGAGASFLDVFLSLWLPRCRDRESCVDLNCLNWSRSAWKLHAVDDVAASGC